MTPDPEGGDTRAGGGVTPETHKGNPIEGNPIKVIQKVLPGADSFAYAQESTPRENELTAKPETAKPKQEKTRSRIANEIEIDLPDCIPFSDWSDWLTYRREIKRPVTPLAAKKQIKFLTELNARGQPAGEVIAQSIRNGWYGLFELKNKGAGDESNKANSRFDKQRDENAKLDAFQNSLLGNTDGQEGISGSGFSDDSQISETGEYAN